MLSIVALAASYHARTPLPQLSRRLSAPVLTTTLPPEPPSDAPSTQFPEPSGSVLGATALVAGTTIGAGVLALPATTLQAGFAPSAAALVGAWAYMCATGLLIAEANVNTLCSIGRSGVSIGSMASETLGAPAQAAASLAYAFIHYCLLVAYFLQGGQLLLELAPALQPLVPASLAPALFAAAVGAFLFVGAPAVVETVNTAIVVGVAASFGALLSFGAPQVDPALLAHADAAAVVPALPVMVLAFTYHNVVPTITYQLGCDLAKVRTAVIAGSALPLLLFVLWNGIVLGSVPFDAASAAAALPDGAPFDPLASLRAEGGAVGGTIALFSILAILSSAVGFIFGLVDFYADLLAEPLGLVDGGSAVAAEAEAAAGKGFFAAAAAAADAAEAADDDDDDGGGGGGLAQSAPLGARAALFSLALLPPVAVALSGEDAASLFFSALDTAGTYGILTLFGILPAAMSWAQRYGDDASPFVEPVLPGGRLGLGAVGGVAVAFVALESWERLSGAVGV